MNRGANMENLAKFMPEVLGRQPPGRNVKTQCETINDIIDECPKTNIVRNYYRGMIDKMIDENREKEESFLNNFDNKK